MPACLHADKSSIDSALLSISIIALRWCVWCERISVAIDAVGATKNQTNFCAHALRQSIGDYLNWEPRQSSIWADGRQQKKKHSEDAERYCHKLRLLYQCQWSFKYVKNLLSASGCCGHCHSFVGSISCCRSPITWITSAQRRTNSSEAIMAISVMRIGE